METTMAATPQARQATAAPSSRRDASGLLAFPVPPPPPETARMMPVFAFPPPNDPNGPTRAQEVRPTRRTTVRVRVPRRGSLSNSLAGLASLIENAPVPALPESVWTLIGRAWFFIAGATMGILLALALIAISGPGPKRTPPREGRTVTAEGTARVLVVQRAATAADRGVGALAENDLDEVVASPVVPAASPVIVRRNIVVARRPATAQRPATSGKDILTAGL